MDAVAGIDLSLPGSPSLVMRDLSEYSTLPFLGGFDVQSTSTTTIPATPTKNTAAQKRITYIGLVKKTMPMLVDLFTFTLIFVAVAFVLYVLFLFLFLLVFA